MSCIITKEIVMCGNFVKLSKRKPKNWSETGYEMIVPYSFKWRQKLGKVECDCKFVKESYQPYYGFSWFHLDDCEIMKHIEKFPGITNLVEVDSLIAQTD